MRFATSSGTMTATASVLLRVSRSVLVGLAFCFLFEGCGSAGTTDTESVFGLRFGTAPAWMEAYCHKAADDLGYPVLCPRALPPLIDIVPCRGPAPAEVLWGKYCSDYVLDALFRGPPGYEGFGVRTVGHLAIWTISTSSGMWHGGFFGCPSTPIRGPFDDISGHKGLWWACPMTSAGANLNSGHVGFEWISADVVYGVSLHGITDVNRRIVRELVAGRLDLVGPES